MGETAGGLVGQRAELGSSSFALEVTYAGGSTQRNQSTFYIFRRVFLKTLGDVRALHLTTLD